jgi:glycosyltransferase involved in cell wall biosynthesis
MKAENIVLIVHYFPPMNASGAKRMEAMSKYFTRAGRNVTVITTAKSERDGCELTEQAPVGVSVHEIDWLGRKAKSEPPSEAAIPHRLTKRGRTIRRLKDIVMRWFGQLPDPRLPFTLSMLSPFLNRNTKDSLRSADIIVATCPPWPPLLAAVFARWRFRKPIVLDYRDQFSMCHEMAGSRFAKMLEVLTDKFLARRASAVVAVSQPMADYYARFHPRTTAILNGYDPDSLEKSKRQVAWRPRATGRPLVVRYMGITTLGRIPRRLLAALRALYGEGRLARDSVRFEYYGEPQLMREVVEQEFSEIAFFFEFLAPVSYQQSLELIVTADHLLFCENGLPSRPGEEASASGILTTKLFEYLASGRPIIADISPNTLAGSFVKRGGPGHFVSDATDDFHALLTSDHFWNPPSCEIGPFVRSLSRAGQADQYLEVLDQIVSGGALAGTQAVRRHQAALHV